MSENLQDVARLQPASACLNIILKNTHFKDDILAENAKIQMRVDYSTPMPILVFNFSERFYDFWEVLDFQTLTYSNREWLEQNNIIFKLIMSDNVITDKVSTKEFVLDGAASDTLRKKLASQKTLDVSEIKKIENTIYLSFKIQ